MNFLHQFGLNELAVRLFPRLAEFRRRSLSRRLRFFPSILSVELTNRCNAACIMCPRQFMTRPQGFIKRELLEMILQEVAWNHRHVKLFQPFLFGESLLHPEFPDFIRLIREFLPHVKVYLSTNGGLLDDKRSRAILEAGVDKLNVDIDGFTAPVAEKIRRGVKLATVTDNVHAFLRLRSRLKGKTRLRLSIIRLPENRHEIDDFQTYWHPLVDQVQMVDLNTWLGVLPEAAVAGEIPTSIPFDFPCGHPYDELAIGWDGRATMCCLDFDFRHPVGEFPRQTIREVWRGHPMEEARAAMESGRYQSLPICRNCNAARFQQTQLWRHLWKNSCFRRQEVR
jgi:hypothetical protein